MVWLTCRKVSHSNLPVFSRTDGETMPLWPDVLGDPAWMLKLAVIAVSPCPH